MWWRTADPATLLEPEESSLTSHGDFSPSPVFYCLVHSLGNFEGYPGDPHSFVILQKPDGGLLEAVEFVVFPLHQHLGFGVQVSPQQELHDLRGALD